ncbi:enoyl-CoA hydratase/isomerase family protein [Pseudenhygromyxa sp. WMMC2535]|uniref:enoyl-CoA hydratase/isomerase family protein n=1 Tax=Pseudenhygromyxa sp. WMMC2535 TaxID=2712867 RepID=UPI0015562B37|nr:enoyl-CoA hydratase-related protein [Pseudenhygromyxa sp. WMMC2535]NVB36964.1 enoyl-CoA hydratase/isomerase family protein [Pseudenhygromyxa sp. WMMC2535]
MSHFELPKTEHLKLRLEGAVLHLSLDRPEVRNAMSFAMVEELIAVFDALEDAAESDAPVRAVVLRGAGGHFCAGGDVKDMAKVRMTSPEEPGGPDDPLVAGNRLFGTMLSVVEAAPQAVIAVVEGAAMGGGFGLACVADVTLARADAKFRLPETSLGIPPAQIAPFIVRRIGLTQARRLAVTGGRLDGDQAKAIGLVHESYASAEALETGLAQTLADLRRCAPGAVAVTKDLMISALSENLEVLLDRGARDFARAIRGPEGVEGTMAFVEKREPKWARTDA